MNLVFVYGSLKKGFANHRLLSSATLVGQGELSHANLFSLGFYPAVIAGVGVVSGEVYEVDEKTLSSIDALEGHPDYYRRETHLVYLNNMNGCLPCHVYMFQHDVVEDMLIEEGEWKHEHIQRQAHALRREGAQAV